MTKTKSRIRTILKVLGVKVEDLEDEDLAAIESIEPDGDDLIKAAIEADLGQDDDPDLERFVPIAKVDTERRLVTSVVYEPDVPDAHEHAMTAEAIEKAAFGFMRRYGELTGDLGIDHARSARRNELSIVESFIAPVDFTLGEQSVTKGSWVITAKVLNDDMWLGVKSGRFTGWSFEGIGKVVPAV